METFAQLDHERVVRRGYPEAVYCEGKTPHLVVAIAADIGSRADPAGVMLFTRAWPPAPSTWSSPARRR